MAQRSVTGPIFVGFVFFFLIGVLFIVPTVTVSAAQDGDFTYTTSGSPTVATVTGYTGAGGAIIIPATLGGYPTVAIGDYAFSTPHYPLTSLTIPDSVVSIGIYAFANCNDLSTVDFGSGLVSIGHHAFYYCLGLTSLAIPDSVTSIGLGAFYHCPLVSSLTIGNNVTTIGAGAFIECVSLTSLTIPDSVTTIDFLAFFRCNSIVQVHLGNGLTMLGHEAFSNCTSLATVTIPDSVNSIGYSAFSYCPSLASVTIGKNVTSIGYEAFRNCTGLSSISFRESAEPSVGADWILNTAVGIRGHAYATSDFPAPGNTFNGLIMGTFLTLTVPGAPTSLSATPSNAQVTLNWVAPADDGGSVITNYNVYRSSSGTGMYSLIASPTGLGYTDTGLTNGLPYWYNVSAVNAVGEGEKTALRLGIPFTVPNAPVGLMAAAGNAQASLNWTAPTFNGGRAIDYYVVYQDGVALADHPTGLTTVIAGLTNGLTYSFTVAAHNLAGLGAQSDANTSTPFSSVPGAPTGLIGIVGDSNVTLNWTAPAFNGGEAIDYYVVYQDGVAQLSHPTGLSTVITGLTNGQTYLFTVAAHNNAGNSAQSASASIKPYAIPNAPTLVSAVPSTSEVILTWSANGNGSSPITGYKLYRSDSENGTYILIASLPGLTYTDTSLTGLHTYWYKVSAVNAAGVSANSTAVSAPVLMHADAVDDTMLILAAVAILIVAALVVVLVLIRRARK